MDPSPTPSPGTKPAGGPEPSTVPAVGGGDHDSRIERQLRRLAEAVLARPFRFIWPQVLLFLVCVGYTVTKIGRAHV